MEISIKQKENISYNIYLENDFNKLIDLFKKYELDKKKIFVVIDAKVYEIYQKEIDSLFSFFEFRKFFILKSNEENKSFDSAFLIYKSLFDNNFNKDDVIVSFGGGIVCDLTAFVASTYLRGLRLVQIPSTLLSIVDASIGGKTAVNYEGFKNIIGTFYPALFVYTNLSLILTLDEKNYNIGLVEVIKHALIKDFSYYEFILENKKKIKQRDLEILKIVVKKSLEIKKYFVEKDFKENNIRAILNFGHTLAHALEKYTDFSISHGESVALGMLQALKLSEDKLNLDKKFFIELKELLEFFSLKSKIKIDDFETLYSYLKKDKKVLSEKIRYILLEDIEKPIIYKDIVKEDIKKSLRSIIDE